VRINELGVYFYSKRGKITTKYSLANRIKTIPLRRLSDGVSLLDI